MFAIRSTATALALIFAVSPAFAFEGQAVFDQLSGLFARQGATLTASQVTLDGDDVVLSGVSFGPGDDLNPLNIEEVRLQDVVQIDDSYRVGVIEMPAFTQTKDGKTLEFGGAAIDNLFIPGPSVTDPILASGMSSGIRVGAVKFLEGTDEVFSMQSMSATSTDYQPGGAMAFEMSIDGMTADMTKLPEAQARETMAALGYDRLNGNVTGSGNWDTASGRMVVEEITYAVDDAAELVMRFDIGGYTAELLGAMVAMQEQMKDQSEEAQGLAMLGLLQQLEINSLAVELSDKSLTNRLLDFFGQQQGMDRASMVAMAKGVLPLGLAQLQDPAFAAKASAEIGKYLDNPGTLKIVAAPASPVPVAQIMSAVMTTPQALIGTLAVDIMANE